jgi:hypothetical protein
MKAWLRKELRWLMWCWVCMAWLEHRRVKRLRPGGMFDGPLPSEET